jgi:hypothetical protein
MYPFSKRCLGIGTFAFLLEGNRYGRGTGEVRATSTLKKN